MSLLRHTLIAALWCAVLAGCATSAPNLPPIQAGFTPAQKTGTAAFAGKDLLAEFEGQVESYYQLGEGDQLGIKVWGRPEVSGQHIVGPDGRVSLPLAGPVRIAQLGVEEAQNLIAARFSAYYQEPVVHLSVDQYVSNRVVLLGRVQNPGVIRFETAPTLLETLARAGALPVLDKQATLTRCAVIRGRNQMIWIDLKNLLSRGDIFANIRLRSNDVVYIPDSDDTLVYVLGEVTRPGAYRLTPDMSLMDAVAQAGGPNENGAAADMTLYRAGKGLTQAIPFDSLVKSGKAVNVALEEGDVIHVPRSGIAKLGYVLRQLSPAVSFFMFGQAVSSAKGN